MILFIILALGAFASADKLDRTYLPPPGSKFAGGSPDAILPPIEVPKDSTVSASTVRPIQPGFSDNQRQYNEGNVQAEPNRQYSQRPGVFGSEVTPGVTSYSEVTRQPGFSSSQASATSVIPYHPYSLPSTTTSYAFTQTTTFSPVEEECVGSTCDYEEGGFVDSGIEPEISISHQTPDQYSQVNQAQQKPGFSTQAPIRTQTVPSSRYPENSAAQHFDNEGRPIAYDTRFESESPVGQQTQSNYPSNNLDGQRYESIAQGRPSSLSPGQSTFSTIRPTLPSHLGTQPPAQIYHQQGGQGAPYQPSKYFNNNRPSQSFDQQSYKVTNVPSQYPGNIAQGAPLPSNQTPLSYDRQGRPIRPNYSQSTTVSQLDNNITKRPIQSFDQRGLPVSNVPSSSPQYHRPSSDQVISQGAGDSDITSEVSIDEYRRPVSSESQAPVQHIDEKDQPISLPSGDPSQYPGHISQASIDQQGRPIIPISRYPDRTIQVDQHGRPIFESEYPSGIDSASTPIPITSISPNVILQDETNRLPGAGSQSIDTANNQHRPQYQDMTSNRSERPQADSDRNAVILDYKNIITPEGEFAYSYDTSNGIHADENGTAVDGVKAQGSYSYIGDDGKLYSIEYTADENGYQPRGDHLPTPPPIPEEILRVIEKVNQEKAAGIVDDGIYDEEKYGYKKYQGAMDLMQPGEKYVYDSKYESGSDKSPSSFVDETEDRDSITNERTHSNIPYRGRPSIDQRKQDKTGRPQKTGGRISETIPSGPDREISEADIPSDYDDQNIYTDERNQITESVQNSQRPFNRFQNNNRVPSRRPIENIISSTRKPVTDGDKFDEDEYFNDENKPGYKPEDVSITRQRMGTKGKDSKSRPEQDNRFNNVAEQVHHQTPNGRFPQNKQRLPSKSKGKPGQQIYPVNDDQQYIGEDEESDVPSDDQSNRFDDIYQRRPSMRGMMHHKVSENKGVLNKEEEYPSQEKTFKKDEKILEPTRISSGDRIQRPDYGNVNVHPTTKYPGAQVSESEEYFDSDINSNEKELDTPTTQDSDEPRRPYSGSTRRPTVSIQPSRGGVRKGYDTAIQASTAKPSVTVQAGQKSRGYQYIPPKTAFDQNNRQASVPVRQKPGFTTTGPFTTPVYSDLTEYTVNEENIQGDNVQTPPGAIDHTVTPPLGYFDSSKNISLPLGQGQQPSNKQYGQRTSLAPMIGFPSRRPNSNRPAQKAQDNYKRPGTYSTPSIPTAGTTRNPSTPSTRFPQNQFDTNGQKYSESGVPEAISGDGGAQEISVDYNNNIPSQSGTRVPSGRPGRPGYPTTSKPFYGQSRPTTTYPNTPAYSGTQTTQASYPEYSSTSRDYTGAKFVTTGAPETFNRYTPSGVSEISTPGQVTTLYDDNKGYPTTARPGSSFAGQKYPTVAPHLGQDDQIGEQYPQESSGPFENLSTLGKVTSTYGDRRRPQSGRPGTSAPGQDSKISGFEQQVPHRPTVDKDGRPISTHSTPGQVTTLYDDHKGYPTTARPGSSFAGQKYPTGAPHLGQGDQIGEQYPQESSGAFENSSTPGKITSTYGDRRRPQSGRPGTSAPGKDSKISRFEQQVPQRPTVDKYGRPISTHDGVKGEDFKGPKQTVRFDPETGYHY